MREKVRVRFENGEYVFYHYGKEVDRFTENITSEEIFDKYQIMLASDLWWQISKIRKQRNNSMEVSDGN